MSPREDRVMEGCEARSVPYWWCRCPTQSAFRLVRHLLAVWGEGTPHHTLYHPSLSFLLSLLSGHASSLTWNQWPSAWHKSWPGVPLMSAWSASGLVPRLLDQTQAAAKGVLEIRVSRVCAQMSVSQPLICTSFCSGSGPSLKKISPCCGVA